MGDWQRASLVPELSVSILKASQLAMAGKTQAIMGALRSGAIDVLVTDKFTAARLVG